MSQVKKELSKFLTSPSAVAHALDWVKVVGGSILSMNIGRDFIDLSISHHPQSEDRPQTLPSIPIKMEFVNKNRVLSPSVAEEFARTLRDWQVCGIVVSWPVQEEGWVGAPCGRVWFTLEQLVNSPYGAQITGANRKICLWNFSHRNFEEDGWGRAPVYAHASAKTVHYASKEQYEAPNTLAVDVWNDYCHALWPELYKFRCVASQQSALSHSPTEWATAAASTPAKLNIVKERETMKQYATDGF